MGYVRFPRYREDYEADVAAARAGLGGDAFEGLRGRCRGLASLTPTEVEVVRLIAEGLTNPQIGEKMFISRGTVNVHLSHIFTKLGVATRAELASEATRRDV